VNFDPMWFRGRRALVMGLGLFGGGAAVTRFLARLGADVTVTDLRSPRVLAPALDSLSGVDVRTVLGRHDEEDFRSADVVVVNPAVPPSSPFLQIAKRAGARMESETNLFFQACRSRWILGVTGSNGKSTTTALLGAMLRSAGFGTFVGGNIGRPLIEEALEIGEEDRVVLELSSFQLEDLARLRTSPRIGVVTNLTPNHLDRHGTMEAYVEAKKTVFRFQDDRGTAVLNADDPATRALAPEAPGETVFFSVEGAPDAAFGLSGGRLFRRHGGAAETLLEATELRIPGRFNAANALAAGAAAMAAGAGAQAVAAGARSFTGLPHRLERVAERGGVAWYNDSIATTPESAIAALSAFEGGIVLIAGGYDKGLDYGPLCREASSRARAVVLMGATAEVLERELREAGGGAETVRAEGLSDAVEKAASLARPGDAVLLSPAAASYDRFLNFQERGERFREKVLSFLAGGE